MVDAKQLQALTPESGDLLYRSDLPSSSIEVRELNGIRWLHQNTNAAQAAMLIKQPHELILPYTRAMLLALCLTPTPNKLLNLGFGGGMFARFFKKMAPDLHVFSVDNQAAMVTIAQNYFSTDTSAPVALINAEEFVATNSNNYDIILCDLFNGQAMPEFLFEENFFGHCRDRLSQQGILSVNILGVNQKTLTAMLVKVRQHLPNIALLEFSDFKNIILFASQQPFPTIKNIESNAPACSKQYNIDFSTLSKQLVVLPE